MSEEIINVPTMHEDHRNWQSEHSMWLQDLASWSKQIKAGLSQLDEVQQMLQHQQNVIAEHELLIQQQEESLQTHEHDLANCDKFGVDYQETLTRKHLDTSKQIERTRQDHDRIKKYHHGLMARLLELEKAMDRPM